MDEDEEIKMQLTWLTPTLLSSVVLFLELEREGEGELQLGVFQELLTCYY